MATQKRGVTVRDFLEALERIHKFVTFGERVSNIIQALSSAGLDINKVNPNDFGSLIRLAGSLRSQGYDVDESDIIAIREEFEEILDMDLEEINRATEVIRRFSGMFKKANYCIRNASKQLPTNPEAVNNLFTLFGLQPKIKTKVTEEIEELEEEIEEEEISDELKSEFKEIAEKYRKMKQSKA